MNDRAAHLDEIRRRIERDEYAVDPGVVADAILAALRREPSR